MKKIIVVVPFLFTACKKEEKKAAAPEGAAAKIEVSAKVEEPAAAPAKAAPTTGPIQVKANFEEYNGDYDGSKAVFLKHYSGETRLAIARGCPSFSCESVDVFGYASDAFKQACPKATWLVVEFTGDKKEAKAGTNKTTIGLSDHGGGTTMTGNDPTATVEIAQLGADVVTGTLAFGEGDDEYATYARGPFTAKVCPTPQ